MDGYRHHTGFIWMFMIMMRAACVMKEKTCSHEGSLCIAG